MLSHVTGGLTELYTNIRTEIERKNLLEKKEKELEDLKLEEEIRKKKVAEELKKNREAVEGNGEYLDSGRIVLKSLFIKL